jgi:hypothetical protein
MDIERRRKTEMETINRGERVFMVEMGCALFREENSWNDLARHARLVEQVSFSL